MLWWPRHDETRPGPGTGGAAEAARISHRRSGRRIMSELLSPQDALDNDDLHELWPVLSRDERAAAFHLLPRQDADEFFLQVSARDQAELLSGIAPGQWRSWVRLLAPDDAADLVQEAA